jgi:hypothetical protein
MKSRTISQRDGDDDVITPASRKALAPSDLAAVVVSGLDEAIASIRRRTARLAYLIIRREYVDAWCEARDLQRAIDAADVLAFAVLELPEVSDGVRRLHEVRNTADAVLQLAPTPSAAAIRLAFGSMAQVDRTLWDNEIEQWLGKLAAIRPAPIGRNILNQRSERAAPRINLGADR